MKWNSLFAAALAAALALPAWAQDATGGGIPFTNGRSISVNFATGQSTGQSNVTNNVSGDALFGLDEVAVAGSQWDNITGESASNQALKVSGAASGATLTFRAGATWSVNNSSTALGDTNALLGSFLDDGTAITVGDDTSTFAAEITVSGIPFETYDVYLYSNVNNGSGFKPIQVNDTYYTYANGATVSTTDTSVQSVQWGATAQTTPQLGRNVLVVSNVTGDTLTIRTLTRIMQGSGTSNIPRGSFAGFQIVERVPPTISVNFIGASGMTSIKAKSGVSGLVGVANANWNEGASSGTGASANNAETDMALVDNQGTVTPATLTYAMGGAWVAGTNGARNALLGEMGKGYCDNPTTTNTIDLSLRNIPYTSYSLILYYGTDKDAASIPWSAPKVTDADGVSKWYSYPANHEGKAAQASDAEVTSWGSVRNKTGAYGDDVMLIENLSGDIDVDLGVRRDNVIYGSLCGFQIICTGEVVGALAPSSVMSLNFASGGKGEIATSTVSDQTGNFGLAAVPAETWVDLTDNENADRKTVTTLYGESDVEGWSAATVTWDAQNSYSYKTGQVTDETEPFLKTYLDDGGSGASVNVDNLPFAAYDVIVYNATDSGKAFYPVTVNSVPYTWDDSFGTIATEGTSATYGHGQNEPDAVAGLPTATLGVNALRVDGLTASALSIQGVGTDIDGNSETYVRAGIAAVQIVARKLITVSTQTDWTTLSAGLSASDPVLIVFKNDGSITGDVTLPADTILDFSGYTFGETAPFTDSLTMNGGTIRLPAGFESGRIATFFSGNNFHCFIAGKPVWLSKNPGDGALSVSYMWTGYARDNRWSTPGNWSSLVVPGKNADVLFMPAASRPETVILDTADTVASVTITGPASGPDSGTADLAIAGTETGSLTVSGQMLTTGNVTVSQSADITVNGASELYQPLPGSWMPELASFQVHQATYTVTAGTLAIPNEAGDLGVSGHGTVEVSGTGTIVANRARGIYYDQNISNAQGTFRVAESGVLALAKTSSFAQLTPLKTLGGTLRATAPNVRLSLFAGLALETAPVTVEAVEGATLTLAYTGSNGALLSGSENLTLKGPGSINFNGTVAEDYSGTVTIAEGTSATLGLARPPLAVESEAKVTVTAIDPEETGIGEIAFPTEMETIPDNVTFVVNGLEDGIEVTQDIESNQLVLKWAVEIPAMTTDGAWGTATNWDTQTVPTSGVARLDGGESGIEVTLDTELSGMESIIVSGVVSLKTTETQSRIPASITLEKGATLTIDAPFSGVGLGAQWELPVGTTLRVADTDFTGWYALNMQGLVEFLPSGSAGSPIQMDTDSAQFHGGLTITGDYVQLSDIVELGGTVTLAGNNISLTGPVDESATGKVFHCTTNTRIVNGGTGNRIYNLGGCTGTFLVNKGTLSLEVVRAPIAGLVGLVVAKDATLTFEKACVGGQYPLSGEGTVVIAGTLRPQVKAFELDGVTYNTIPAKMVFVATEEEQTNGVIQFLNAGNATVPANFVAEVIPVGDADVWVPVATNGNPIRIRNVPAPNGVAGLEEAVALAIRRAAAEAGVTDGNYTVWLTTKEQTSAATAATLNDVLGCFTGLKPTAEGTKLTYAYDFGITGLRRDADNSGWVVTAKVQGAAGAKAGFAEDNVYTLTVNGAPAADASATVDENGTVTFTVPDASVAGETCTLGVKVSRPAAQTPAQ